jgi:hypothetical protein
VTENTPPPGCISPGITKEPSDDAPASEFSGGITLERLLDEMDEMSHLNEFILCYIEKNGGFTTPEAYFSLVQPVLDLLEVEIRVRFYSGITKNELKLIVQDWIDREIALLHKT